MFRLLHWFALTTVVAFMLLARWLDDDQPQTSRGLVEQTPSTGKPFEDF
ncbi:hypothetical protein ABT282_08570 [Streptomyces sp. NPDC000927]